MVNYINGDDDIPDTNIYPINQQRLSNGQLENSFDNSKTVTTSAHTSPIKYSSLLPVGCSTSIFSSCNNFIDSPFLKHRDIANSTDESNGVLDLSQSSTMHYVALDLSQKSTNRCYTDTIPPIIDQLALDLTMHSNATNNNTITRNFTSSFQSTSCSQSKNADNISLATSSLVGADICNELYRRPNNSVLVKQCTKEDLEKVQIKTNETKSSVHLDYNTDLDYEELLSSPTSYLNLNTNKTEDNLSDVPSIREPIVVNPPKYKGAKLKINLINGRRTTSVETCVKKRVHSPKSTTFTAPTFQLPITSHEPSPPPLPSIELATPAAPEDNSDNDDTLSIFAPSIG